MAAYEDREISLGSFLNSFLVFEWEKILHVKLWEVFYSDAGSALGLDSFLISGG
mgnify:FL=1